MKKMAILAIAMLVSVALMSGMANANPTAMITTNKNEYQAGETVLITVTNNCRSTIVLNGFWIEDESCANVYTASEVSFPKPLAPGETFRAEWDQVLDSGEIAAPGAYTVMIDQDSAKITILASAPSAEISTDSQTYTAGEEVQITVTNVGNVNIMVNGFWVEDSKADVIYTPNMPFYMLPLMPGHSIAFTWDQTDNSGNAVQAGTYTVCTQLDRAEIAIFQGAVLEVAADNTVYETGEKVTVTIANTGDLPTVVSNGFSVESHGILVYAPDTLAFMIPLNPGMSIEFTWEQTDSEGHQVAVGAYTIITQAGSVTIEITGPGLAHGTVPGTLGVDGLQHFTPKPVAHNIRI